MLPPILSAPFANIRFCDLPYLANSCHSSALIRWLLN